MMIRPWINLLAGAWAVVTAVLAYVLQPYNFIIIGLIIAVFGFWTYRKEWQGVVNGIIGLWFIFSAFVPALTVKANLFLFGLIVMALATWRLIRVQRQHPAAG